MLKMRFNEVPSPKSFRTRRLLQIYASYKYPRPEVDKLKPGAAASIARKFDGSMVVSDYDKSTRRVGPFQMKPAVALR